jgi:hypothetical protein
MMKSAILPPFLMFFQEKRPLFHFLDFFILNFGLCLFQYKKYTEIEREEMEIFHHYQKSIYSMRGILGRGEVRVVRVSRGEFLSWNP